MTYHARVVTKMTYHVGVVGESQRHPVITCLQLKLDVRLACVRPWRPRDDSVTVVDVVTVTWRAETAFSRAAAAQIDVEVGPGDWCRCGQLCERTAETWLKAKCELFLKS